MGLQDPLVLLSWLFFTRYVGYICLEGITEGRRRRGEDIQVRGKRLWTVVIADEEQRGRYLALEEKGNDRGRMLS